MTKLKELFKNIFNKKDTATDQPVDNQPVDAQQDNQTVEIEPLSPDFMQHLAYEIVSAEIENEFTQQVGNDVLTEENFQKHLQIYSDNLSQEQIDDKFKSAKEILSQQLQYYIDEFVTMDASRFDEAYTSFVQFIGATNYLAAYGNSNDPYNTETMHSFVYYVEPLDQIMDVVDLQMAYQAMDINKSTLTISSFRIRDFADSCRKCRGFISNDNLATLYYHTAKLYDKIDTDDAAKNSQNYLIRALRLAENPQLIDNIYSELPDEYSLKDLLARQAIARAKKNEKFNHEGNQWLIHKIWAQTYKKNRVMGPKNSTDKEVFRKLNHLARNHYSQAAWTAPTEEVPLILEEIQEVGGFKDPGKNFINFKGINDKHTDKSDHTEDLIVKYILNTGLTDTRK